MEQRHPTPTPPPTLTSLFVHPKTLLLTNVFSREQFSLTMKWKHPDRIFQQANFLKHVFVFVCLFSSSGIFPLTKKVSCGKQNFEPITTHLRHHLVVPFTSAFVWFLKSSESQQNNVQVSENQKGIKDKSSFVPSKNYHSDRSGCWGTFHPTVILRKHPQETGF